MQGAVPNWSELLARRAHAPPVPGSYLERRGVRMEPMSQLVEEVDLNRGRIILLMAEFFKSVAYRDVRARLPGYSQPLPINGSLKNHQPDVTCLQGDTQATGIVLDAVPIERLTDPETESRWTLFYSAADLYGAEFHIAVPRFRCRIPGPEAVRLRLRDLGIRAHYVWGI